MTIQMKGSFNTFNVSITLIKTGAITATSKTDSMTSDSTRSVKPYTVPVDRFQNGNF